MVNRDLSQKLLAEEDERRKKRRKKQGRIRELEEVGDLLT